MAAVGGACLLGYDLSSSLRCVRAAFGKYRLGVLVWLVLWVSLMMVLNRPYFRSFLICNLG